MRDGRSPNELRLGVVDGPVQDEEWPAEPEIERVPVRSCVRPSAAIDLALTGHGEPLATVFTTARGRDAVFWQSVATDRSLS